MAVARRRITESAAARLFMAQHRIDSEWRRLVPPMFEIGAVERRRTVEEFLAGDRSLPRNWRSFVRPETPSATIIGLRRA